MEPMTNSNTKQRVLRRARFIRLVRPFTSGAFVASVLTAASLYGIGREVWVARVLANMPSLSDASAVLRFIEVAFLNTSFSVQMLSLVLVFGMLWAARDTARNIHSGLRIA